MFYYISYLSAYKDSIVFYCDREVKNKNGGRTGREREDGQGERKGQNNERGGR